MAPELGDRPQRADDPAQIRSRRELEDFLAKNAEQVFFSRQLEVLFENRYFHWITNRTIRDLVEGDLLSEETRPLISGANIHLLWPRRYRYYKRAARRLEDLVNEYAESNVSAAVGLQGGAIILEGFARARFVLQGRHTNEFRGLRWTESGHTLDFIFERDGIAHGVEVKNTLGYMDEQEFQTKIRMSQHLGVRPVFAARMLPRTWIGHLARKHAGFALIFKYQLYPWGFRDLAKRVREELGLPVDSPRALAEGTMQRFLDWHQSL